MEIQDDNRLYNFSPGLSYIPSLVSFGACSDSEKCDHFGHRKKKKEEEESLRLQ